MNLQLSYTRILFCLGLTLAVFVSNAPQTHALQAATAQHLLPDAPQPASQAPGPQTQSAPAATATLSGTVLDTNHDVLQGAQVTLAGPSDQVRNTISGSSGEFSFTALPPGAYRLKVSGSGMSTFKSQPISLEPGAVKLMPPITLSIAVASASVTVNGDKEELSEEQVQIAEQQRVLGVIPNFYSSYDWNAPPMLAKQKFKLSLRSLIDPVTFLEVAGIAGAEQYKGIFPAYGCCLEGYGKRYGAAFANQVAGDMLGRAVYPALFHQDPRYFYKGTGGVRARAFYAMSQAVVARSDSGRLMPNYSQILGNLTSGALSNLYYPEQDRGARLVFLNGLAEIGANAAGNLIREFVLKDLTSRAKRNSSAASAP
ncbi:carboxypeptidase regulatory-like domain-containing protein [Acidobacteria bacterium AB60]|nr:carboxypeptidase regulatory-like domain-containing protein [Acidobacteria bacterium AB60]